MRHWNAFLLSLAALATISPSLSQQPQPAVFQGAWRIVRTSLTTDDQPGLEVRSPCN